MDIKIEELKAGDFRPKDFSNLKFGENFTDRMFVAEYHPEKGWNDCRITRFGNLSISPAATVFHYAQTIFEGLKAFGQQADGGGRGSGSGSASGAGSSSGRVALFRPRDNIARLNASAERMCMPVFDEAGLLDALIKLVSLERGWVPMERGKALYIRPTMFGIDPVIKVRTSNRYLLYIILSPVGPYFASGYKATRIYVEDKYVRAVPGGTGEVKAGGNYGASLKAGAQAQKAGYDQVLWLDALERK